MKLAGLGVRFRTRMRELLIDFCFVLFFWGVRACGRGGARADAFASWRFSLARGTAKVLPWFPARNYG
jgi:hypothetical protein